MRSAVLGDLSGGYLDALREPDGEGVAAVMGFLSSAMTQAGDQLGLGDLRRISFAGEGTACVVAFAGASVMAARIEPARSLAAVEKALEASLLGKG
ncbi:MAG TPA: hypothetical protein VEM76_01750 [Anaeromyxobacteraceae bacterium]|nr:hypothetical protein [Anaeromyxobacteraceae bacterium]